MIESEKIIEMYNNQTLVIYITIITILFLLITIYFLYQEFLILKNNLENYDENKKK